MRKMEYPKGRSLEQLLRKAAPGRIPLSITLRVIADAARSLHAAHERRTPDGKAADVVHRDVAPQNVFVLHDGVTKVVDFGTEPSVDARREQTQVITFTGKITYASPEKLNSERLDRRTDVWALGVILFEATTGCRLFERSNAAQTILAVANDPFPRPSDVLPGYPYELENIVMATLQRDPADRTPTAMAFAQQLESFLERTDSLVGVQEVSEYVLSAFADEVRAMPAPTAHSVTAPMAPVPTASTVSPVHILLKTTSSAAPSSRSKQRGKKKGGTDEITMLGAVACSILLAGIVVRGVTDREHEAAEHVAAAAAPAAVAAAKIRAPAGATAVPQPALPTNGAHLENTPLASAPLPAGTHQIRITPLDGGRARVLSVQIEPGKTPVVSAAR